MNFHLEYSGLEVKRTVIATLAESDIFQKCLERQLKRAMIFIASLMMNLYMDWKR